MRARCLSTLALVGLLAGGAAEAQAQERGGSDPVAVDATGGRDLEASETIRIRVRNDLAPAGGMIISVVALTRPEEVLGAVRPNEAVEWVVDSRLWAGGFRIVARGNRGRAQVSRTIDVTTRALVHWNLGTGLLRVERIETGF